MPRYTPRQSSNSGLIAAAIVFGLFVAVAAGGFIAYRAVSGRGLGLSLDTDEQAAVRVNQLCHSLREDSLSKQLVYWLQHGCTVDDCKPLKEDLERAKKETDTLVQKGKERWGEQWPGLGDLDPKRLQRFETFEQAARKLVQSTIQRHDKLLEAECQQLNAKLAVEYPLTLEKMPTFNRDTVQGQRDYEEWQIRQPAQDKLARAQREAKIAREYANRLPVVSRKRILACRDECREGLAKLEEDFRKQ